MHTASDFLAEEIRNPDRTFGFNRSFKKTFPPWRRPIGKYMNNNHTATNAIAQMTVFID